MEHTVEVLHWSLSAAYKKKVSLNDILKDGDWTNADTFISHYYAHASDSPIGQIILNKSSPKG